MKCVRGCARYLSALQKLEEACFDEGRRESAEFWQKMLDAKNTEVWIAKEGKEILGAMLLEIKGATLRINSIGVDPPAQGKGAGSFLMRQAEKRAKSLHLIRISLEASNELPRLEKWYRTNGYFPSRFLHNYYGNGNHARRFVKDLTRKCRPAINPNSKGKGQEL